MHWSLLLPILGIVLFSPLQAQWRVGLGVGRERAAGFAEGLPPKDGQYFVPWRPLNWTARVETPGPRWRGGLEIRYSDPYLSLTGNGLTVIAHNDAMEILAWRPSLTTRLVTLTDGVALRAEAGPLIERWSLTGEGTRWRLSPEAGVVLEIGLGGRFTGLMTGSGSVTPTSPFVEFLPDDYEPRAGWRWGLRAALLYGLSKSKAP